MAKKDYHKPPEDPKTIGGGTQGRGRERREARLDAAALPAPAPGVRQAH